MRNTTTKKKTKVTKKSKAVVKKPPAAPTNIEKAIVSEFIKDIESYRRLLLRLWRATEGQLEQLLQSKTAPIHDKILAQAVANAKMFGDIKTYKFMMQTIFGVDIFDPSQFLPQGLDESNKYVMEIPSNGRDREKTVSGRDKEIK